jgi:hypothetical protein
MLPPRVRRAVAAMPAADNQFAHIGELASVRMCDHDGVKLNDLQCSDSSPFVAVFELQWREVDIL